jgi:septal ring factor EnvC (AmiA/AmiB activator)
LSDEWLWSKETILLYGPAWRNALREEMDGARAGWPSLTGATAPVVVSSSESTLRAQLARANEDLAAARVQIQQQQEQIAHLQKEQQQQQQPAGMELEMLTSRDNQIAALKKELAEVHKENTRLLELLADQEIALMK